MTRYHCCWLCYFRNSQPRFQFIVMNRRNTGIIPFLLLIILCGTSLFQIHRGEPLEFFIFTLFIL